MTERYEFKTGAPKLDVPLVETDEKAQDLDTLFPDLKFTVPEVVIVSEKEMEELKNKPVEIVYDTKEERKVEERKRSRTPTVVNFQPESRSPKLEGTFQYPYETATGKTTARVISPRKSPILVKELAPEEVKRPRTKPTVEPTVEQVMTEEVKRPRTRPTMEQPQAQAPVEEAPIVRRRRSVQVTQEVKPLTPPRTLMPLAETRPVSPRATRVEETRPVSPRANRVEEPRARSRSPPKKVELTGEQLLKMTPRQRRIYRETGVVPSGILVERVTIETPKETFTETKVMETPSETVNLSKMTPRQRRLYRERMANRQLEVVEEVKEYDLAVEDRYQDKVLKTLKDAGIDARLKNGRIAVDLSNRSILDDAYANVKRAATEEIPAPTSTLTPRVQRRRRVV